MQSLKLLRTSLNNLYSQEWDRILTPGEAILIHCVDTDQRYLKIGDGKQTLRELPKIWTDERNILPMCKTCAQCEHLCIINRNKIYAVCDETGKVFELWRMDTREADACNKFISKEEKITTLKCPYCGKPMRLIAGNPTFTYWECDDCNKSFEYNIWTEKFQDED